MKTLIKHIESIPFVNLSGDVVEDDYDEVVSMFQGMLDANQYNVVINLASCNHIHTSIIPELIEFKRQFNDRGGDIKLINVSDYINSLFSLYGFHPFEIYPSRQAVLKSIARMTNG